MSLPTNVSTSAIRCSAAANAVITRAASVLLLLSVLLMIVGDGERLLVSGHGMMLDPPGRSSMWRFGFSVPTNYDDNGLNCGGREAQHGPVNQGRCGECGDEWRLTRPRLHDEGGRFGTGVIGQTYTQGSLIRVTVNLTANHLGFFQFRLCTKSSAEELVTQSCLDRHLLEVVDQTKTKSAGRIVYTDRFLISGPQVGHYFPLLQLPAGVTCNNCVLQWYYTTGNSPGLCGNGTNDAYCYQESFVNCADIQILP